MKSFALEMDFTIDSVVALQQHTVLVVSFGSDVFQKNNNNNRFSIRFLFLKQTANMLVAE